MCTYVCVYVSVCISVSDVTSFALLDALLITIKTILIGRLIVYFCGKDYCYKYTCYKVFPCIQMLHVCKVEGT